MKKYLQTYLANHSSPGRKTVLGSVACRYRKFTMYSLIGPEENIIQLTFARQKHEQLLNLLQAMNDQITITQVAQEKFRLNDLLTEYFSGTRSSFPMIAASPLLAAGTDFQKRVWQQISTIPYGSTITYQRLAELAGSPRGFRAAGMACGANPVALFIPCHRVVAQNGLGGFAGGIAVKKALLALEQHSHT